MHVRGTVLGEAASSSSIFFQPFTGRVPPRFWQVQPYNNTLLYDALMQFEPHLAYKRNISLYVNHIGQERELPSFKDIFLVGPTSTSMSMSITLAPAPAPHFA